MRRPRQKGPRKAHLKRFASDNVKIRGNVHDGKMSTDPNYGYGQRAATIGASFVARTERFVQHGTVHEIVAASRIDAVDCHPHKTIYTRGKGNELNSSVPRVWTIAQLYQSMRSQQNVRFQRIDLHRHKHGGISMYFTTDQFFFVEIDTQRNIGRRSKIYTNKARAYTCFRQGTITWIVPD